MACIPIVKQLEDEKCSEEVDIKLRFSILKPLYAGWVVDFYNHITSEEGRKVIFSGLRDSGITDAIRFGIAKLLSLDPFQNIDPMAEEMRLSTPI